MLLTIGPSPKVLGVLNNKVDKYFIVLLKRETCSTKRVSECVNYCSNRRTFFSIFLIRKNSFVCKFNKKESNFIFISSFVQHVSMKIVGISCA